MNHHRQYGGFRFLLARFFRARTGTGNIFERSAFENLGRGIAHIEEDLIERTMGHVAIDQIAQLFGIAEGGQGPINQANDVAQLYLSHCARADALAIAQHGRRGRLRRIVADYDAPNVSEKVVRIILSYTDYVNRTVWRKP